MGHREGGLVQCARGAPNSYLLGSYRIATAPEPSSSRLTSLKSICFDSPANNVGPWPASLGCTTNSYSSINPSSANASGSFTPPTNSPLPDSRLSCCVTMQVFVRGYCTMIPRSDTAERFLQRPRRIHLVMDNLNIHSRASVITVLGEPAGRRLWQRMD